MATQHFALNATITNAFVGPAPQDFNRRFLYVRNYSGSVQTLWVAFGQVATPGNNGELEIVPGNDFVFGGSLSPGDPVILSTGYFPNCPIETINFITSTGTAKGCVIVITA